MENLLDKTNFFKKMGWVSIALCGLCCTLPLLGGITGMASITTIAYCLGKISIITLLIIPAFFIFQYFKKKQEPKVCTTVCDTDCKCSAEPTSETNA